MTERYIELHANSAFSFLEGGSQPEALAERAFALGMPAMALMDRNGFYGSARFHKIASENGIKAHVGAEISVTGLGNRLTPPVWLPHQHLAEPTRLPLLCETREGYQNLCQLITRFKMREKTKQEGSARLAELEEYSRGLVCLTGGEEGPLAAALMTGGEEAGRDDSGTARSHLWTEQCLRRSPTSSRESARVAKSSSDPDRRVASSAVLGNQRSSLRNQVRSRDCRPLHGDSQSHAARSCRTLARSEQSKASAPRRKDGRALPRCSGRRRKHGRAVLTSGIPTL